MRYQGNVSHHRIARNAVCSTWKEVGLRTAKESRHESRFAGLQLTENVIMHVECGLLSPPPPPLAAAKAGRTVKGPLPLRWAGDLYSQTKSIIWLIETFHQCELPL
jgi:hypothetical protein